WVYTGQFFDADGIVSFGSNIDDDSYVAVDGTQVMLNTANTSTTSGVQTLGAGVGGGWHTIEIRVGNGAGGGGANNANGWTNLFGLGIAPNGTTSNAGTSYVYPIDNGSMNLF